MSMWDVRDVHGARTAGGRMCEMDDESCQSCCITSRQLTGRELKGGNPCDPLEFRKNKKQV